MRRRVRELGVNSVFVGRRGDTARLRDAARGVLLGTFVGDALGMPYEGRPPRAFDPPLELEYARLGSGTYIDDTQMTIALADRLAERAR